MTRDGCVVLACLIGLALLGFFQFPGHTWLQQDTQIWIPMFDRIWDSTALRYDIVADKPHLSYTIYDETAVALRWVTRTSFHAALIWEQILFRVLELSGAYLLARSFGLARHLALFVAACFGLGATIVGPAVLTFEYEPVPRGFALGFLWLAIGLAARGRPMPAACSAAIGFLYHPPTAIPVLIVLVLMALQRREYRPLLAIASACVLLFVISRFQAGATEPQVFFERIDPSWEKLERLRAAYNWVSTWAGSLYWQYVLLWALSIAALWRVAPKRGRTFAVALPLIGVLSVPVSYILTERAKWAIMPQVQPARALLWVTAFAVILSAAAGVRAAERRAWFESVAWFIAVFAIPMSGRISDLGLQRFGLSVALAALACGAVLLSTAYKSAAAALFIAAIVPYFAIPFIGRVQNYPNLHTPEIAALSEYARASTPKDAMFLFADSGKQLYPGLFRAEAMRSVYVDWKAGGQVNFFRSLAEDWWKRWQETMSGQDIQASLERFRTLGINYLVLKKDHPIAGSTPVYSNPGYLVYRLQ